MKHLAPLLFWSLALSVATVVWAGDIESDFLNPPDSARPWVYWYFMDGNLSREGLTADLESMKRAGIGGGIFLEVNVGVPRGPVEFMSPQWQKLFAHAVHEADRLGLQLAVGTGPGWCGTGGPWVKPEESMQHLVASESKVHGPTHFAAVLSRPQPRPPFFGLNTLTPELVKAWQEYYADVAVLAFPTPQGNARVAEIDEKALYSRAPFSSAPGVKTFLPEPGSAAGVPADQCIASRQIVDLTSRLTADGRLEWDVPTGDWTILRFGRTSTGQCTRPAPLPGLGFESDKFDAAAIDAHFAAFTAKIIEAIGPRSTSGNGLTTIHFDSWEMSSQNWSRNFRAEFEKRRGYDPLTYLPVMTGRIVQNLEVSERFLWDLRQTAQELVIENHALRLKELGRRHGLQLSLEPYDMNPTADLNLGSAADVPMCEFWSKGHGFATEYSCLEAVSIGHTGGAKIIAAESFTATDSDTWLQYPTSMKAQTDWALATGINRLVFHRYQHQPTLDQFPGMTMGPYGVHWERTETWWDMVPAYHRYLARCQQMLRRGMPVADILYLTPEGAPHVFRPPTSATTGELPDRRGYNFDGVSPDIFIKTATVKDGRIAFPGGMTYRVLVLPRCETMTPRLLKKIAELVEAGATVMGQPPCRSPSLTDYPQCDKDVQGIAARLWNTAGKEPGGIGKGLTIRSQGAGLPSAPPEAWKQARRISYPEGNPAAELYPSYATVAAVLAEMGNLPDFASDAPLRYTHRHDGNDEIYFVANRRDQPQAAVCQFRVAGKLPERWDPVTGRCCRLPIAMLPKRQAGRTGVQLEFAPYQSAFIVFRAAKPATPLQPRPERLLRPLTDLAGPWEVSFDPAWGGPEKVVFDKLEDWTARSEEGIRHYSGMAVYRKQFDLSSEMLEHARRDCRLSLGVVHDMASVKLNGRDFGVVWCDPWELELPAGLFREQGNALEITVANRWPNRMIGDQALPPEQRRTKTNWNPFQKSSPLLPSGLIGPVRVMATE